ncbi:MAG: CHAT domain-containing protein [Myxococcota bacterium]
MKRFAAMMSVATTLALGPLAAGCSGEPSLWVKPQRLAGPAGASAELAELPELRVEYGGCATVRLGAEDELECIYEPGAQLRLWVMHEDGQRPAFAMEGGGAWSMGEPYVLPEELGQGYRLELTEAGLRAVTVELPQRPKWRLALRAVEELSQAERVEVKALREEFARLEKKLAKPDVDALPEVRNLIEKMIEDGRLGQATSSTSATAYHLIWRAGRPQLAEELITEVKARLEERLPLFDLAVPIESAALTTHLGHALRRRGQLARAANEYRRSTRIVRRVDSLPDILDAMAPYALVLAQLGYFEAAAYWSAEVRDLAIEHAKPYALAQILIMVAKVSLHLREARQVYDDPAPRLDEVERIYGKGGPLADRDEPLDAVLSRAELALLDDDPNKALALVEPLQVRVYPSDRRAKIEELWSRSQIELGADERSLRHLLAKQRALAGQVVGPELQWRNTLLEARILDALGDSDRALAAYLAAEELLDRLLQLAALGLPGDFAAARHSESTDRLVSLLIADGKLDQALCAIRRSRARLGQLALLHLRLDEHSQQRISDALEQYRRALLEYEEFLKESEVLATPAYERARWLAYERQQELEQRAFEILSTQSGYAYSVGCEELAPRRPGELFLVLHTDGSSLRILVEDDLGVAVFPSLVGYFDGELKDDLWQSDLLLHPLRERIASAKRIRVLASGEANSIPVHALPWSDNPAEHDRDLEPLAHSIPVVYGLDLPSAVASTNDNGTRPMRALVVSDDQAEGASDEATAVSSILSEDGWEVDESSTTGRSPAELRELVGRVNHFHYAGHAYYAGRMNERARGHGHDERLRRWPPYSGGAASMPTYIPFGENGRLGVQDILMMEKPPTMVVLMGCTTGVVGERTARGGFSLATAFLGAGAQAVIASTHDVDGEVAAILGKAIYADLTPQSARDAGRWMTNAIRHARAQGIPRSAIANYRVYVP